jgi:hypothetical protein
MPTTPYRPLHSIYGHKLGVDKDGFLVGPNGLREGVETITAASTLDNVGVSVLTGTTLSHTLGGAPAPGVRKTIINASTVSTATMSISRSSTAISFMGSTSTDTVGGGTKLSLLNSGSLVELIAISTSVWAPLTIKSTLYFHVSTSS